MRNFFENKTDDIISFNHWDRKIIRFYWVVNIIILITEIITILVKDRTGTTLAEDVIHRLLLPSGLMFTTLLCAEWAIRFKIHSKHYFLIVAGSSISIATVMSFPDVYGIQATFILSIFSSISFFDFRKATFSSVLNISAFLLFYFFHSELHSRIGPLELVITLCFYCNSVVVVFSMIGRGIAMHRNLVQSIVQQQDLMIRNVLMEQMSKMDALTDLYNHRSFQEFLDRTIEQADLGNIPLQLAILDIDNFKSVNDTFGHSSGDVVLRYVADTIKKWITTDDIASRYGGEEFAIIMTGKTAVESIALLEELRKDIARKELESLAGGHVTISIGLWNYTKGEGKQRLFDGADSALYESKRTGKNKTTFLPC